MLLQGMIKRDPGTRLGAWENPPQDIMSAPFFHGIQWDAIYERRFDGPYVPEIQYFGGSKSKSCKADASEGATDQQGGSGNHGSIHGKSTKEYKTGTDGSDSDSGEESESELKGLRDSVFIRPHDGGGNNLLDWSFIDEKVLAETYAGGDPDEIKAAKRAQRKKKKRAAAVAADAKAAASELKISEEIENNKVGFASKSSTEGVERAPDQVPIAFSSTAKETVGGILKSDQTGFTPSSGVEICRDVSVTETEFSPRETCDANSIEPVQVSMQKN